MLALAVSTGGCDWLKNITLGEYIQIIHKSPKLTLAWDPPLSDAPNLLTRVVGYQVYYREHDTFSWRFLDDVPASPHPEYTIEHSKLGNGLYDFAVRAITASGQTSPMHTSLDSSADPVSGWYVLWAKSD